MFFRQVPAKDASLSYYFGCTGKGRSIAVDVVLGEEQWYLDEARRLGVPINFVVDTHIHADHYSGGRSLAEKAGAAYCLHESAAEWTSMSFVPLRDGQVLDVGNTQVRILHTPGHTPESICLLVTDLRRGDAPWFVMTGDTLFVGSVGRPDLAGRERDFAATLYDSLHAKLLCLPNDIEVFPAHQAGSACGAGLSGKPSSTIGFEKRWNPLLSLDRASFIDQVVTDIPAQPPQMQAMRRANLGLNG
jgi:glyoxylase-like metal-dependent hydrolase (beta-lactamase superfamily II)